MKFMKWWMPGKLWRMMEMENETVYEADKEELFANGLNPFVLKKKLWRCQRELGYKFGITELLKLEEIRAKIKLAEAIRDFRIVRGPDRD